MNECRWFAPLSRLRERGHSTGHSALTSALALYVAKSDVSEWGSSATDCTA